MIADIPNTRIKFRVLMSNALFKVPLCTRELADPHMA